MINTNIRIVEALTDTHLDDVRKLISTYAKIRNYDEAFGDYKKELAELPGSYAAPEGMLLVAYFDNEAAGCVAYRRFSDGICEMKRMYVDEKFRGNRIGLLLGQNLIENAKNAGYYSMYLDTHPWMHSAMEIYASLGFKEIEAYHYNPTKGIRFFELKII